MPGLRESSSLCALFKRENLLHTWQGCLAITAGWSTVTSTTLVASCFAFVKVIVSGGCIRGSKGALNIVQFTLTYHTSDSLVAYVLDKDAVLCRVGGTFSNLHLIHAGGQNEDALIVVDVCSV